MRKPSLKTAEIIDELSQKLYESGELFREAKDKYDVIVVVPWIFQWFVGWNPIKGYKKRTELWEKQIMKLLEEHFPNSVYIHQFLNPHQTIDPDKVEGWRTRYLKRFQAQIEQLQKIIYALKQEMVLEVKQSTTFLKDNSIYHLTYDQHTHEIKLNGLPIAKPRFSSENDQFIEYVINHPNKTLEMLEVEKELRIKLSKPPSKILTELGFKGSMRKIFFTDITKNTIKLISPITDQYASDHNFPRLKVS